MLVMFKKQREGQGSSRVSQGRGISNLSGEVVWGQILHGGPWCSGGLEPTQTGSGVLVVQ